MPVHQVHGTPWTRRHDDPRRPLIPQAPTIVYPSNLQELIEICRDRPPGVRFKAAGSHWALSPAAISDNVFIETHDPTNAHRGLDRTLHGVVPHLLHPYVLEQMESPDFPFTSGTFIHIEAGKRIYQLYAELDQVDDAKDKETLAGFMAARQADHFRGPWGVATLGGAGGQTVVGALSTGTHGGDFDRGVLPDSVLALHIVSDGGNHYWVEPSESWYGRQLMDDEALTAHYTHGELSRPGAYTFHIIRDTEIFESALVNCGRFGIIYSVVMGAKQQYSLWERRRMHLWQDVRHSIKKRKDNPLYEDTKSHTEKQPQRFLQIVVCLTPHLNFQRNLVGITKRWELPLNHAPAGQEERVGSVIVPPPNGSGGPPVFSKAGASFPYSANSDRPLQGEEPGFLDRACSNAGFLAGILEEVINEIEDFVESNGAIVGVGIAAIAAVGAGALLTALPALALIALVLKELLEAFDSNDRLGEHMEGIKNELLDPSEPDPLKRAAGLFAWQMIAYKVFEEMQGDLEFGARSYAVMDRKNYLDRSCEWNVESVEVFFDANDDRLVAFVDALIAFEINQEFRGKAFLGYASLRFTGRTRAKLGMQRWKTTCAIEVAGLADLSGSRDLVEYATQLALNPNIGGILHWGQRNTATASDIERLFGIGYEASGGPLARWRSALGKITGGGDAFSSEFTRHTGLEP